MDSSGVASYSLPRTSLHVTATDESSPVLQTVRKLGSVLTLGRSGRRGCALRIDIGYEPFFIDFAERTGLTLIGGEAPRVDPDFMPAVCPPVGARAVSLLGVAGLLHGVPTGLELWQSHTSRAVDPTGVRTDLVFRIHAPAPLPPSTRTVNRSITVETLGQDLYVSASAPTDTNAAGLNAFLDVCESASRRVLAACAN